MSFFLILSYAHKALADLWGAVTQGPNSVVCVLGTRHYKAPTSFY